MSIDVEAVLKKLNLAQKIKLLSGKDSWHTAEIPEFGIPSIRTSDGPTGVRGNTFFNGVKAACFPCGTALGATWDTEILEGAGKLMSEEARAKGVHVILGPTVNIQRSPLGGRGFESFAEDPVLSGKSAAAVIKGIQSTGIQATIKHFICNDQEDERNSVNVIVSERALREVYLMPFQIAVRESQPGAVMTSYNKVNGVHASQNTHMLSEVLRGEWRWKGLVMSDWHGLTSLGEAVVAGLDLEMPGPGNFRGKALELAVLSKQLPMDAIDDRVRSMLNFVNVCMKSGVKINALEHERDTPETSNFLRRLAADGIVLLKNESDVLPLSKEKTIAVIGPNAKITTFCGGGSSSLRPYYVVSPYDGIAKQTKTPPLYGFGVNTYLNLPGIGTSLVDENGNTGYRIDMYDLPQGHPARKKLETTHITESFMILGDFRPAGLKPGSIYYMDLEGTLVVDRDGEYDFGIVVGGKARLFVDDKLVVDNWENQTEGVAFFGSGTLEERGSMKLKAGQKYTIKVHYSSESDRIAIGTGVGGLQIGFLQRRSYTETISEAVELARQVDQVVLTLGLNSEWESEGYDRASMDFPPHIDELVAAVVAVNPNTVVVNQSGTPVTMDWHDKVPAIVQAWYGGNETGNAIADVLFGNVNPNGKLPLSWPIRLSHNPAYYSFKGEAGRVLYGEDVFTGYRHYDITDREVLFPFGHGLSYTEFSLTNLSAKIDKSQNLLVSCDVTNTGSVEGKETVQIYISHKSQKVTRPVKELKGFSKVKVAPGKKVTAKVSIPVKYATSYWHEERNSWLSEAGDYTVHVATSSRSICQSVTVKLLDDSYWNGL